MLTKHNTIFFVLFLCFKLTNSACKNSYLTICDTFEDFINHPQPSLLTDVLIGSTNSSEANKTSINLMNIKFNNYNRLASLTISGAIGNLSPEPWGIKCRLPQSPIRILNLFGNNMPNINRFSIPEMNLYKLGLVNNKIKVLENKAIYDYPVEYFDASDNVIEVVESNALPKTNKTKIISLRNNRISFMEAGCLPLSLEHLNLDHNQLGSLDNLFDGLKNLKELTLSYNKFWKVPKMNSLKKLVVLDLSHNELKTIPKGTFSHMEKLLLLDLSYNLIKTEEILNYILTPNKQPKLTVNLAFNKLNQLVLKNINLQQQLFHFYGNAWDCNDWIAFKTKFKGHEGQCDKSFLSRDSVPYCINYKAEEHYFNEEWRPEIDNFQSIVMTNKTQFQCYLSTNTVIFLENVQLLCIL